jgi:phosphoglycolate phosphatase-like HAD superfamily hydrolase
MIYIFDIDGTLADISQRLHFIQQKPADWYKFFSAAGDDASITEVIYIARALAYEGHRIVYSTGRPERTRELTKEWLYINDLPSGQIFMRADKDHREDFIVKSELLDYILHTIDPDLSHYGGVFEDRQQVVDMYRARGLRVFQVAPGNF